MRSIIKVLFSVILLLFINSCSNNDESSIPDKINSDVVTANDCQQIRDPEWFVKPLQVRIKLNNTENSTGTVVSNPPYVVTIQKSISKNLSPQDLLVTFDNGNQTNANSITSTNDGLAIISMKMPDG